MKHSPAFSVSVYADVPREERDLLVLALSSEAQVQENASRAIDPEAIATFLIIVGSVQAAAEAIKASAEAGTAIMELAEKIRAWRERVRKRGVQPNVKLHRPSQPALDLRTATDEEVLAWLMQTPTS